MMGRPELTWAQWDGMRIIIPRRRNENRFRPFDRTIYRLRDRVERLINGLKQFRRLATRHDKRAENYGKDCFCRFRQA
jgi:transposase